MEYSVFDTHCDTLCKILDEGADFLNNSCEIDLERMRRYRSYTQVMACFIAPEHKTRAKKRTLDLINTYHRVTDNIDLKNVKTILSIEGGEGIDSIRTLDKFYALGVRMAALTWNFKNHIAGGAYDKDAGLTDFGADVVKRMNKLGMFIDVSHLNDRSFYDIVEITKMPIIASHSCSRRECDHIRNLTDDMFNIIVKSGGCVGINLYPVFLTKSHTAAIDDVIRHIEHFMSLGGENNIGIGSDFDGTDGVMPTGISGCEDLHKIFDRLLQLNYGEELVEKISHRNFAKIFEKISI